ncbi:MAG: FxLYD domain-containing protein, partial [Nitrososphaera sp.]|uniref:FxLYD domain-containing protein n=1 Tax=Nitrososphaera sp. TaxID=1971748 RepID=UPI003D6DC7FF
LLLLFVPLSASAEEPIELENSNYTFVDSEGFTNIVGVVNNRGHEPIGVTMALDVVDSAGANSALLAEPYGSVIFPGKGAPFKFRVQDDLTFKGKPYVLKVEQINLPFYDALVLNYTNMAVGEGKVLTGTVKNTGSFEVRNVAIYASVHNEGMVNLDSAISNVIPSLAPGQEAAFTAAPDPAVRTGVYYYSCAGFDLEAPITTLPTGDGKFIAYDLEALAKISSMRYDNSTDSIAFGIKHYNPAGGQAVLKFPQLYQNQTVAVIMDAEPYDGASIMMDGKTVHIDMFVPPGDHEVKVQGVRVMPEFPFAVLGLAAAISAMVVAARKAAFKIS